MKKLTYILIAFAITAFWGCNPNEDIYNNLDEMQGPYNESIEYTLSEADYNSIGGEISTYNAFNDTLPAKDFVPDILADKFIALNVGSSALVTFNHLLIHPVWWDAGFGYELTPEDYDYFGIEHYFSESNPAVNYLPDFLTKEYPDAEEGDEISLIYNYSFEDEILLYLDVYEFDGEQWLLIETKENLPYVGYELTSEDYDSFGGSIANNNNFSENNHPDDYLPGFLRSKFPLAPINAEQVVKYNYYNGSSTEENIDKYVNKGNVWEKVSIIEERSEQYIYGELGWAFDPTVTFLMNSDDYMYLAELDPIPHPVYNDFGYYYGASAYYSNFDIRLAGRRLNKDDDGNYYDPELAEIYENEGEEAAEDEMFRRILEEGLVLLLEHKFADATPQIGGVDVHYIVQFETFGDGFERRYLEAEYKCVSEGTPAEFEFVDGPRDRE